MKYFSTVGNIVNLWDKMDVDKKSDINGFFKTLVRKYKWLWTSVVGYLTKIQDPRVMVTCEPAGSDLKAGKLPSDYSAYRGAGSGDALDDMSKNAGLSNGAGFAPGIYFAYIWINQKPVTVRLVKF